MSRIWESPPSNGLPTNNNSSRQAQLPSIATLTNNLPAGANGQTSSPTYPPNNRDSDQWPSQPQSTRTSPVPVTPLTARITECLPTDQDHLHIPPAPMVTITHLDLVLRIGPPTPASWEPHLIRPNSLLSALKFLLALLLRNRAWVFQH